MNGGCFLVCVSCFRILSLFGGSVGFGFCFGLGCGCGDMKGRMA